MPLGTIALSTVREPAFAAPPQPELTLHGPQWHARLGQLARAIGTEHFHERLLASYGALIGHDSAWIIRYARNNPPDVRYTRNVPSHVLDVYHSGYDAGDPFFRFWAESGRNGVVRLGDVLTADNRAYWKGFQLKARIADEMAMIFPIIGNTGLALFLERAEVPFSEADEALAKLVFPAFEGFHRAHKGQLFNALRRRSKAAELDLIRQPTLILDRSGATAFVNAAWRKAERADPSVKAVLANRRAGEPCDNPERISPTLQVRVETFDRDFPLAPDGRMFVLEPVAADGSLFERLGAALGRLPSNSPVTPREQEILALTIRGRTTGEIAQELSISKGTIKNHRLRIYRKFGVSSERALVSLLMPLVHKPPGRNAAS